MKKLAGLANNLSVMALSESASELYEELINLPDGTVIIDLLAVKGSLNESIELKTLYPKKLSEWLFSQIPECGVQANDISSALITINLDSSTVPCDGTVKRFV